MNKEDKLKKVTVFDIAEALNISASTVSRSLNDHSNISKKTKKKVLSMAKKMGYGMGLKYKESESTSKLIALVIPSLESSYYIEYSKHLQYYLSHFDYNLVIFSLNDKHSQERKVAEQLTQFKLAAVVVALASESENAREFKVLDEYNIPWIMFDQVDYQQRKTIVKIDNKKASKVAISHLINNGFNRIAHLAGHPNSSKYNEIVDGYKEALHDYNIDFDPDLLIYSDLTNEDISESMYRLLSLDNPPNAIFTASSNATLEAHHFLDKNMIRIPEEVAIVSYGFERALKFTSPSISHIFLPIKQLAQTTSDEVIELLRNSNYNINTLSIEAKFILKKSSLRIFKKD